MTARSRLRMTLDQYLRWEERQERKHELVNGAVRLASDATIARCRIALNLLMALQARLCGSPCEAFGSGLKMKTSQDNIRYPHVLVDCGELRPTDQIAAEPRVAVEVLSLTADFFDQSDTLNEYKSVPGIAHIVFLSQTQAHCRIWTRTETGWNHADCEGLESAIALPAIGAVIPMAEAYEDVEFESASDEELTP